MNKYAFQITNLYKPPFYIVLICISLLLSFCLVYAGMATTPDSWTYIDGAYNLSNGLGYNYICNHAKIVAFQPLYSFYMSLFMTLNTSHGLSILISNAILLLLTVLIFVYIKNQNQKSENTFVAKLLLLTFIIYLSRNYLFILSENLFYPAFFISLYLLNNLKQKIRIDHFCYIIVIDIFMISTRNSAIIFCISSCIFIYMSSYKSTLHRLFLILIKLAIAYLAFKLSKYLYGAVNSHPMEFGNARYHWYEYLIQSIGDIASPLISSNFLIRTYYLHILSFTVIIILLYFLKFKISTQMILFIVISYTLLFIVINMVDIFDPLNGRYLAFIYLVLFAFSDVSVRKRSKLITIAVSLSFCLSCFSTCYLYLSNAGLVNKKQIGFRAIKGNHYILVEPEHQLQNDPNEIIRAGKHYVISPCYSWTK